MGRHFETAELQQAEASGRTIRRIELVDAELGAMGVAGQIDQQVAQQPIDQPRLQGLFAGLESIEHLLEGDFQFIDALVTGFVNARRLAGRADEQAGEQVGKRRMILPIADQAHQQIGTAQQRRVSRRGAAQGDMVAPAGARVAAVEHELLRAEARQTRFLVEHAGIGHQLRPGAGRMNVDLDDAGIGRDLQFLEARIAGRAVAFQADRRGQLRRAVLDGLDEVQPVFQQRHRRQEYMQHSVAHLDGQGGMDDLARIVGGLRRRLPGLGRLPGDGEIGAIVERVALELQFHVRRRHPGQRGQRQAQAQRRLARYQVQVFTAQRPGAGTPALGSTRRPCGPACAAGA